MSGDIVFMDTETLGLDPDAPVWEFAAIRRDGGTGEEERYHCFIDHEPGAWLAELPEAFQIDYIDRFNPAVAVSRDAAAGMVWRATKDAHVVGAVPSFDAVRLGKLLASCHFDGEPWHYHLIDVENVIVGYLAGTGEMLFPPYSSNDLSLAIGVNPANYERHTAMGDVHWVKDQWDAVIAAAKAGA